MEGGAKDALGHEASFHLETERPAVEDPGPVLDSAQMPTPDESIPSRPEKIDGAIVHESNEPPAKRLKIAEDDRHSLNLNTNERKKGFASVKAEYLVTAVGQKPSSAAQDARDQIASLRDDGAEDRGKDGGRQKAKGQNKQRTFGSSRDALQLCMSRAKAPELSPANCQFGSNCKYEHDLRKYLREGKRDDLTTFDGSCPVWDARGKCNAGWRCRFARAHSKEIEYEDGMKELVLIEEARASNETSIHREEDNSESLGVVNAISSQQKIDLKKRKIKTTKAEIYTEYLSKTSQESDDRKTKPTENGVNGSIEGEQLSAEPDRKDNRARYVEPPFLPSEKRRLYYGSETPVLAPLTTQGNLPFRRLCVELGAQVTWSEMAMGLPLIQGEKAEWALMKAHQTELGSPRYSPKSAITESYDNSNDIRFGAQISANKPWLALKTTEILTALCSHLRAIDLNCGCPLDFVYRQGGGSALLDSSAKLEKMLRGMNAVSGEVPITVKIRMGTKDDKPTAARLIERLAFGGPEAIEAGQGASGVAAVTLHGRSRQQRYTRSADWGYISECASLIKSYNAEKERLSETTTEPDPRSLPNGGKMYFIGNGDCYSHVDYYNHTEMANVDSVMVARGALIKPWIFEEIEKGQYLDKSATERLRYVEKFARYGLENWGSDEIGVGTTRRFLLEWLSFSCRYVPIGLLEHLPPHIQDRPPAYRGRSELETLMASDNFKDWIKISEMFLGPAHKDFKFEPKHKSNSYETIIEG